MHFSPLSTLRSRQSTFLALIGPLPAWKLPPNADCAVFPKILQPAVHIFGVEQGTCPPGTYLKTSPGESSSGQGGVSLGNLTAGTPAQIRDLHLLAAGGQAIELSTQFQPNTTMYGAMVREVNITRTHFHFAPVSSLGRRRSR